MTSPAHASGTDRMRTTWTVVTIMVLLMLGMAAVFGAGVHDYFYQQGLTSVMDSYWMPYAVPLAVLGFTAMLVRRVVDAMHGVEVANAALELRVRERTEALEQANAAKGRFIAAASHDLRQPVASIGLLAGLLREPMGEARQRSLIERIEQATAALESLLKGLLDLSRLESTVGDIRLAPMDTSGQFAKEQTSITGRSLPV